jgi:DNA polymerase
MLTNKQLRILELLCSQIKECIRCNLHHGGRCRPFYTPASKYVIIGEAPGAQEVRQNAPFSGQAGKILWETIYNNKLKIIDFAIINSVNCRPTDGYKNTKPTLYDVKACQQWIRKFIKVIKPEKVLILGNYAMETMLGRITGITKFNATDGTLTEYDNTPYLISVHPAYAIYNKDKGQQMLNESIKEFYNMKKPTQFKPLDDSLFEI